MQHKQLILSYDRPAPRYTSYPPATQFHDNLPDNARALMLDSVADDARISLYLHIPFCQKLCYYCGCFTSVTRKQERVSNYLNALKQEISDVSARLGGNVSVGHIHFGGGSPTMLSSAEFRELMQTIRTHFNVETDAEIAIEADPRQLTESKIAAYAHGGINRMSLGVQDFHQTTLKAVNREQGLNQIWEALNLCRNDYGITNINMDLMYGLPYQTPETMYETIRIATALSPSRIAFFGYAHVPWMKQHMQAIDLNAMPNSNTRYELFTTGRDALLRADYKAIGIDHFVKENDPMYAAHRNRTLKRNFQGYTTDALPALIGLGASAISKSDWGYVQNKADVAAYESALSGGSLPPVRGWQTVPQDTATSDIIESLMCYFKADLSQYDSASLATARQRLAPFIRDGIVSMTESTITIRKEPQLTARLIASAFDDYTAWTNNDNTHIPQRHAQAV